MAGNPGILQARPESILDHDIAVADPARLHFDAHLPAAGLRDRALDELELPAGLAHLYRFHQSHVLSSPSSGGVVSARSLSLSPFAISKHEANYPRIDRS